MIDVRSIANAAIQIVNQEVPVSVRISTGSVIGAGARQVPSYAAPIDGFGQIQALDGDDLKKLNGLNLQGDIKAIYLRGNLAGILRPNQTGGDLIDIDGRTWLVVKVLENWPTWTKAAIRLQGDA